MSQLKLQLLEGERAAADFSVFLFVLARGALARVPDIGDPNSARLVC